MAADIWGPTHGDEANGSIGTDGEPMGSNEVAIPGDPGDATLEAEPEHPRAEAEPM